MGSIGGRLSVLVGVSRLAAVVGIEVGVTSSCH